MEKKTIIYSSIIAILFAIILVTISTSSRSDIKDNFCGIHINFQYCKCAFHNEYCESIGMTKSEAKTYVETEYKKWKNPETEEEKEYGVIEKNGNLYLNSKQGEVLSIKTSDLPSWARGKIATVGATIIGTGPPATITQGDSSVLLDGLPIARIGDQTSHGGIITADLANGQPITDGSNKIFINGKPVAFIGAFATDPMVGPGQTPYVGGPIVSNP